MWSVDTAIIFVHLLDVIHTPILCAVETGIFELSVSTENV